MNKIKAKISEAWRTTTASKRRLPSRFIIGVEKGGTTSLYNYLIQHPDVTPSQKKEIFYYCLWYDRGESFYRKHFTTDEDRHCIDSTPNYIYHPEAPKRLAQDTPYAKIVVLLRNPIDRAYSGYQMNRRRGIEPMDTFEKAVEYELEKTRGVDDLPYDKDYHNRYYLRRSKYQHQLENWLAYFPREQFYFQQSELLYQEPESIVSEVCEFFNLSDYIPSDTKAYNTGSYKEIDDNTRAQLSSIFSQEKESICRLTNLNLDW